MVGSWDSRRVLRILYEEIPTKHKISSFEIVETELLDA